MGNHKSGVRLRVFKCFGLKNHVTHFTLNVSTVQVWLVPDQPSCFHVDKFSTSLSISITFLCTPPAFTDTGLLSDLRL